MDKKILLSLLAMFLTASSAWALTYITQCSPYTPCGSTYGDPNTQFWCDGCICITPEGFCSSTSYCSSTGYCLSCPATDPNCSEISSINRPSDAIVTTKDPIDIFSGEAYFSSTDFSLKGRGPQLSLYREYRSFSNINGLFGYGWRTDYDINLSVDSYENATLYDAEGTQYSFGYNSGSYINNPGNFLTLTKNADNTYTVKDKHGIVSNYGTTGRLISRTDRNGNTLTFVYNPAMSGGTYIQDATGRKIILNIDFNGHVISAIDPAGKTFQYGYDTYGNLVSITDPTGAVTNYNYDSNHKVIQFTNPNGHNTFYQYDTQGRAIMTSQDNSVNRNSLNYEANNTTVVTDSLGNNTTYVFSSLGLLISKTDPLGNVTQQTWDGNMDRTSVTDPRNNVMKFMYDTLGNVLQVTDPLGNVTNMSYSSDFNMVVDTTTIAFNGAFEENDNTYDSKGNVITFQDANGARHHFVYDQYGDLITATDSRGNSTNFTYDAFSHVIQKTDALGNNTVFTYE